MGCFDELLLRCPHCGTANEEQTKAGACMMKRYTIDDAPLGIIDNFVGYPIDCVGCKEKFTVKQMQRPLYSVVAYDENEEY